jgi:dienelactone hydrolase
MTASRSGWRAICLCLLFSGSALVWGCGHSHAPANPPSLFSAEPPSLDGFQPLPCGVDGRTYTIYTLGEGPPVLILHELPGLTIHCIQLARLLARQHFRVYVPLLFGDAGVSGTRPQFFSACVAGGFNCFSHHDPGRIAHRLRRLSAFVHSQTPASPMGVIGLCLSGALPITLMRDGWVTAPVVSEPALPLFAGGATLGVSEADLRCAKARGVHIKALRFSEDGYSPASRLTALEHALLPGQVERLDISSRPGNPDKLPIDAHAVLTEYPTQRALDTVIEFLNRNLRTAAVADITTTPEECKQTP